MINSALNKGIALDIDDTLSATAQTIYTKFHWTIKEASSEFDEIFRSHHRLNEYYSSDPQFIERIEQEVNDANFLQIFSLMKELMKLYKNFTNNNSYLAISQLVLLSLKKLHKIDW